MKQHRSIVAGILNVTVIALALAAWAGSVGEAVNTLEIASLLGILAFSLMWVHYTTDVIAPQVDDGSHDFQYYLSRGVVLLAIVTHPLLVNWYLLTQGFGYPPASYESLLGAAAWAVILGWLALVAFILFELRGKLSKFIPRILYANIIAMFLVLIHGFVAGMFVIDGWYAWVWFFYLVSFSAIAIYNYWSTQDGLFSKYVALGGIMLFALGGLAAGVYAVADDAPNETSVTQPTAVRTNDTASAAPVASEEVVTSDELSARDGKGSNDCWVAVSGVVYDLTGNNEWQNGMHTPSGGEATCGRDLTSVLGSSPHGASVLSSLTQVGTLAT